MNYKNFAHRLIFALANVITLVFLLYVKQGYLVLGAFFSGPRETLAILLIGFSCYAAIFLAVYAPLFFWVFDGLKGK